MFKKNFHTKSTLVFIVILYSPVLGEFFVKKHLQNPLNSGINLSFNFILKGIFL